MSDKKPKDHWLKDGFTLLIFRLTDSGTVPWTMVALFFLGLIFLLTRNLNSPDSLALWDKLIGWRGIAWLGWILALVQIPISRWIIMRTKRLQSGKIQSLQQENERARELLKKYKQSELKLEQ